MVWAPPTGPTTHRVPTKWSTVSRAHPTGSTVIEQISGVAPTPTIHLVERAPNNPVQTPDLDSFQPACSAQW